MKIDIIYLYFNLYDKYMIINRIKFYDNEEKKWLSFFGKTREIQTQWFADVCNWTGYVLSYQR